MTERRHLFLFVCLVSILFTSFYHVKSFQHINKKSLVTIKQLPYRGCIVTLIRSDNLLSLNKLLNMLNSLSLYFTNIRYYTIHLFHESTLANQTKEQILRCASKLKIKFYEIYFNLTIPSNRSGYASMCQFWSYDIWFKYTILQQQCDYVMRFDDDSYLINFTQYDLFEKFHNNQLDYAYRIVYHDTNGLDFLRDNLRTFLPANQSRRGCIQTVCTSLNGPDGYDGLAVYNNFFLIRLNLMYEHSVIETYLKQLLSLNAFYLYRIGDANIQTICLLLVEKELKISFLKFPYNHNVHGSSDFTPRYIYYENTASVWSHRMRIPNITCHRLLIAAKYHMITKLLDEKT
ncbi:unnamed protein product [Rotaria socialis]|uniref:Uncharacterized protein n=1 Tax=Rotaria socialis TaxID=392032 RepID=A0A818EBL9_9BILA|nr:unnamed protein product [Rotaria socialis]CAF3452094.1 unnamed protein product [Rotaria socialis]CAF4319447.1 unnamed protein product [Rotaria socialis]CAF4359952.1 unnamed protein product [Rotaria socialis]